MPYKFVVEKNGLFSFDGASNPHSVEYKLDEWTYPTLQNSLLFVFDTLSDADRYMNLSFSWIGLYECEVGEVYLRLNPGWPRTSEIEKFWNNLHLQIRTPAYYGIQGCYATDKVKLTRKIH